MSETAIPSASTAQRWMVPPAAAGAGGAVRRRGIDGRPAGRRADRRRARAGPSAPSNSTRPGRGPAHLAASESRCDPGASSGSSGHGRGRRRSGRRRAPGSPATGGHASRSSRSRGTSSGSSHRATDRARSALRRTSRRPARGGRDRRRRRRSRPGRRGRSRPRRGRDERPTHAVAAAAGRRAEGSRRRRQRAADPLGGQRQQGRGREAGRGIVPRRARAPRRAAAGRTARATRASRRRSRAPSPTGCRRSIRHLGQSLGADRGGVGAGAGGSGRGERDGRAAAVPAVVDHARTGRRPSRTCAGWSRPARRSPRRPRRRRCRPRAASRRPAADARWSTRATIPCGATTVPSPRRPRPSSGVELDDPAGRRRLARGVQHARRRHRVPGVDRDGSRAADRVGHRRVVGVPRAPLAGQRDVAVRRRRAGPRRTPARRPRPCPAMAGESPALSCSSWHVEAVDDEPAARAVHLQPRPGRRGRHAGGERGPHPDRRAAGAARSRPRRRRPAGWSAARRARRRPARTGSSAWSTRCGPRSSSVPPPSPTVPPCQLPLTGRNRSIREVNRCTCPARRRRSAAARSQIAVPAPVLVRHDDQADPLGVLDEIPGVRRGQARTACPPRRAARRPAPGAPARRAWRSVW